MLVEWQRARDHVHLVRFEGTFKFTNSGIHRPKIVRALGSDGRTYTQLVRLIIIDEQGT